MNARPTSSLIVRAIWLTRTTRSGVRVWAWAGIARVLEEPRQEYDTARPRPGTACRNRAARSGPRSTAPRPDRDWAARAAAGRPGRARRRPGRRGRATRRRPAGP